MKRAIVGSAGVAALAIVLAGCTGNGSPQTPDGSGDDPVTLVVWESLVGRSDFIEQAGEAYKKDHPNVTIEYKNVELGDARGQIALDGPAGVGADVFAAPSNVTGDLVAGGHILPPTDVDALKNDLIDAAIKSVTYEDQIWGVPVTLDTFALFYNKDLVSEPPTTWEEVLDFSREFSADNPGKYGFVFGPDSYNGSPWLFESPNNLLFGPDGIDVDTPNTDTASAVEGITEMLKFRETLDVPATDLDAATLDALFREGNAAMMLNGAWATPDFDEAGLDYGVVPLPSRDGRDTPSGSFANSRTMFVSAYTEHPEVAQDFAAFLASPEMLELAYELTASIPSAEIPVDNEATLALIEQGKYAFPTPSIPEATLYWTAVSSALANIWNGADVQSELAAASEVLANQ